MARVCIVGAGISGLVAARVLRGDGLEVSVLEKSRSLSGRCATRLWNGHVVDHGVQYFTADERIFKEQVKEVAGEGLAQLHGNLVDGHGAIIQTGKNRYYLKEGNNRIGKYLSDGVEIVRECPVQSVMPNSWGIRVTGESVTSDFDAVIVCAPFPQASVLLGKESIEEIYDPCLTAFFEYAGRPTGPSSSQYAVVQPEAFPALAWSACENHKEGRIAGDRTVMVVQASVEFSRSYLESDPSEYLPLLRRDLEVLWELDPDLFQDQFAHRWRYARRSRETPEGSLKTPPGIFLCGDSRVRSRLESVWLDGRRVANDVRSYLA